MRKGKPVCHIFYFRGRMDKIDEPFLEHPHARFPTMIEQDVRRVVRQVGDAVKHAYNDSMWRMLQWGT